MPPVLAVSKMSKSKILIIEACEHYQKKSFRNKCLLLGPNGRHSVSVPLQKGKHNSTPITDVHISYDDMWSNQFLKLCQSNYRKSPYYDFIIDELTAIFNQKHVHLFELNMALLKWIFDFLQFDSEINLTTVYHKEVDDHIEDLREHFKPNKTPESREKPYPQVFQEKHGFVPNLSILDLLFCCGRESINYL